MIGQEEFKNNFVNEKIKKWIKDIEDLAEIAVDEPQAALSAYTKSLSHRWTFVQRTVPGTKHLFEPLERCIRDTLIPAIIGRSVSDEERVFISLPVRLGGLGIFNPTETAEREYDASHYITENLSQLILQQQQDLSLYDSAGTIEKVKTSQKRKDQFLSEKFQSVVDSTSDPMLKRCLEFNKEKGAGSWLTALPLKNLGYCLNKQEFRDAVSLRYGWKIPHTPQYCGCGKPNDVNHTLICTKGGYVAMRHNALRDMNAKLQSEVCRDVVTEPRLLPINNEEVSGTTADRAAPDISSRGLWSTFQRTFFDVRVLHPNAASYQSNQTLASIYNQHEKEKMRKYNSRVITVEKGTFTPLVYTTFGGCGPQATRYHKRIAELISKKNNEDYRDVINHIRVKIRFSLLRSVLIAIRGERGRNTTISQPLSSTSFNLIPEAMDYESF